MGLIEKSLFRIGISLQYLGTFPWGKGEKDTIYSIELYASDTESLEDGGPNTDLVDSTFIRIPHDVSAGKV